MRKIYLGLLGCGTVGKGVVKLLLENNEILKAKLGCELILKKVADLNKDALTGITDETNLLTDNINDITDDPEIDIIIELIGGNLIAKDATLRAIENKKHIVTANKKLLAIDGREIFEKAEKNNVEVGFEASAGGAMPVIKTMRESLCGNSINETAGILNGTCNYILTKIYDEKLDFKDALKQAQDNGFAEADPAMDIDGDDTAHKLAIISSIAYGTNINLDDIYIEGITGISPLDIENADKFGYRIKLLAISKSHGEKVEARVHPTMIPYDHILAKVDGSINAISIHGNASEEIVLHGHGAGMMPTASAVFSDICDIARNIAAGISKRIPSFSFQNKNLKEKKVLPISEITTKYYIRLSAKDSPGVLSKVSGILGDFGISIRSVNQKGRKDHEGVPVVMITHEAKECNIQNAMKKIDALDDILDKTVIIRIEEEF